MKQILFVAALLALTVQPAAAQAQQGTIQWSNGSPQKFDASTIYGGAIANVPNGAFNVSVTFYVDDNGDEHSKAMDAGAASFYSAKITNLYGGAWQCWCVLEYSIEIDGRQHDVSTQTSYRFITLP
jgi:hypothetical protein